MRQKQLQDFWQPNMRNNTMVDTIICLNGCEVIGAYLAQELTKSGIMCMNAHDTIYITSPEQDINGQMIFRDNAKIMVEGKNVLILIHVYYYRCDTGQSN